MPDLDTNFHPPVNRELEPEPKQRGTITGRLGSALSVFELPLVARARESAISNFTTILRKGPKDSAGVQDTSRVAPGYVHQIEVASILALHNFGEEVVTAGLLHDHVEDLDDWNIQRVAREYGREVARLVWTVTERERDLPWEQRKDNYFQQVKEGDDRAAAICAADKISNMRSSIAWMREGYKLSQLISRDLRINSLRFFQLSEVLKEKIPTSLFREYRRTLQEFVLIGLQIEPEAMPELLSQRA